MPGKIISGARELARQQLFGNAARAASGLHGMGIGEGDAVAVMLRNDFPYFETLLAAGMLGAYTVPINWHYKGGEAGYILTDAAAKALVIHSDLLPQLGELAPWLASRTRRVGCHTAPLYGDSSIAGSSCGSVVFKTNVE